MHSLLPKDRFSYSLNFDKHLLTHGRVIMDKLLNSDSMFDREYKGKIWRKHFKWYNEFELNQYFNDNISKHLGISEFNEIKFERTFAHKDIDGLQLRRTRYRGIDVTNHLPGTKPHAASTFYFHVDEGFPLANYKMIVNLNDVTSGGTFLADPILTPFDKDGEIFFGDNIILSENIKEKEILGKAGTVYCASSHILHRASLPKEGYTDKMHLSFTLKGDKYLADKYKEGQFKYNFSEL